MQAVSPARLRRRRHRRGTPEVPSALCVRKRKLFATSHGHVQHVRHAPSTRGTTTTPSAALMRSFGAGQSAAAGMLHANLCTQQEQLVRHVQRRGSGAIALLLCQGVRGAHASRSEARQCDTRGAHRDLGSAAGALCASMQVTHGRTAARYSRRRPIQSVSNAGAHARRSAGAQTVTQSACVALAMCASHCAPRCPSSPLDGRRVTPPSPQRTRSRAGCSRMLHPEAWQRA
jgi:hypothetical protein